MSTTQIPTFQTPEVARYTLRQLVPYFLKLGTLGFVASWLWSDICSVEGSH